MKCIQNFNKKPEGNTQHGRHMHRWKDDDKTNHKETRYEGMDWIKLYQGYGTSYSIKGGKFADELSNYQLLKKQVFRGVS